MMRKIFWFLFSLCIAPMGAADADEFKIVPSVAVMHSYNDNLFFEEQDPEDDQITTVIAGLELSERTERLDLNLRGNVAPFFYHKNDDLNDTDADVLAHLGYRLAPRLAVKLDGSFSMDNRPDREIDLTGLIFDTNRRYRYRGGATMDFTLNDKNLMSLSYQYTEDDWRDAEESFNDFSGHAFGLAYLYDISKWVRASKIRVDAGYGQYEYERAEVNNSYGMIGIESMLSEVFRLQVSGGARYTDTTFDTLELIVVPPGIPVIREGTQTNDAWSFVGSTVLEYLGERTRCSLSASHDLRTAGGTTGPSDLTRGVFAISYRLLEKLTLGLHASYFINKADADEFSSQEIDEETANLRPHFIWQMHRAVALEGSYTYTWNNDKIEDSRTERNLAFMKITLSYPFIF